jgi:F420-non-reducing hydrogenase iron-sulfur subunit
VEYAQKILDDIGIESQRLQMINISAAMGSQFALSAAELTEEIRRMGPNPIKRDAVENESLKPEEDK